MMEEGSTADWRIEHRSLADQLWYLYQQKIGTDVQLLVRDADRHLTVCYDTHSIILARLSPHFEQIIKEDRSLREKKLPDCEKINQINITHANFFDIFKTKTFTWEYVLKMYLLPQRSISRLTVEHEDPRIFAVVLKYAYTGQFEFSTVSEALAIHKISSDFQMHELKKVSEQMISQHIDEESVWDVFDSLHRSAPLKRWAKSYLGKNTQSCLQSARFLTCSQQSLLDLMNCLTIGSEIDLISALVRWARHKSGSENLGLEKTQKLLAPCLKHIRFLSLTPAQFSEHVAKPGLLLDSECLAVLVNLNCPGSMPLPDWICKETSSRQQPSPGKLVLKETSGGVESNKPAANARKQENGALKIDHLCKELNMCAVKEEDIFIVKNIPKNPQLILRCFRGPLDQQTNFKLNKNALLFGVEMETQKQPDSLPLLETYQEKVMVIIELFADDRHIALVEYSGEASYDSSLRIDFLKPVLIQVGEWYSLHFIISSDGCYSFFQKKKIIKTDKVKVTFDLGNKPCNGTRTNLLSGLVLKITD